MPMKVMRAAFSEGEWKEIETFLGERDWSEYRLVKEAVLEKVRKEPQTTGPLDDFVEA